MARPGLAIDPAPDRARPRMPAPVQVVGEAAKALELRREAERGRGDRGDLGRGMHRGAMITFTRRPMNRFSARSGTASGPSLPWPDAQCALRSSPRNASRGQRPAASATSSTRWRARWAGCPARPMALVDVFLPRYRSVAVPATAGPGDAAPRAGPAFARRGGRSSASSTSQADGYRLRLVDHPAAFDRDGLYGPPGGGDFSDNAWRFGLLCSGGTRDAAGGAATDQSTSSTSTTGMRARSPMFRDRWYDDDPVLGRAAVVLTLHNLAYHGWTPRESLGQLGLAPGDGDRRGRRRRHRPPGGRHRAVGDGQHRQPWLCPRIAHAGPWVRARRDAAGEGRPLPRHPQRPRHDGLGPGDRRRPCRDLLSRGPERQGYVPGRPAEPARLRPDRRRDRSSG